MGLMDRVKEAAQEVAVEAKKVSAQAQGKIEETQLKRRMDDNAKQLGYLVFRERTQGVPAGTEAERLVSELTSLELQIAKAAADARAKQEAASAPKAPEAEASPPAGSRGPEPGTTAVTPPPPAPPTSETPPPP
jgi:hypothetical protein